MKVKEKRKPRTYKITDSGYKRAMVRARKEKNPLSSMIEEILFAYGDGAFSIHFTKPIQFKPSNTTKK